MAPFIIGFHAYGLSELHVSLACIDDLIDLRYNVISVAVSCGYLMTGTGTIVIIFTGSKSAMFTH